MRKITFLNPRRSHETGVCVFFIPINTTFIIDPYIYLYTYSLDIRYCFNLTHTHCDNLSTIFRLFTLTHGAFVPALCQHSRCHQRSDAFILPRTRQKRPCHIVDIVWILWIVCVCPDCWLCQQFDCEFCARMSRICCIKMCSHSPKSMWPLFIAISMLDISRAIISLCGRQTDALTHSMAYGHTWGFLLKNKNNKESRNSSLIRFLAFRRGHENHLCLLCVLFIA